MRVFIILGLGILLNSCQEGKCINDGEVITMNQINTDYNTLINKVKFEGDTIAYNELFYHLMETNAEDKKDTIMYYSKIMAEKYNYELAYYNYFTILCDKYGIPFRDNDYSTINLISKDKYSKIQIEEWLKKMLDNKIITYQQYSVVRK